LEVWGLGTGGEGEAEGEAEAGIMHVQARMSHWMEDGADSLDGSYCYWNHDGEPLKPSATKGQQPPLHSNGRLIG